MLAKYAYCVISRTMGQSSLSCGSEDTHGEQWAVCHLLDYGMRYVHYSTEKGAQYYLTNSVDHSS
jgi:hypothetical protein